MAAYTFKWYWKCFQAVGTYFQVVWECVNISTFWRLVLKGPSYSIGLDINFPLIYSVCVCTLVHCMTITYFNRDDSHRFSVSRRNTGLEMEGAERRLLITSSLEVSKGSFPGHAKYKELQYSFERHLSISTWALRTVTSFLCPYFCTTYECSDWAQRPCSMSFSMCCLEKYCI